MPIIDKSQFLKAILVIDKLLPINFFGKCFGKFLISLTKLVFVSQSVLIFQKKRAAHGLCLGIKQNKERFFKLPQNFIDTVYFAIAPTPKLRTRCA